MVTKFTRRSQRGIAFSELALVIPFIVLLIGGVFEVSRVYYIQNNLDYAAKEAARVGSSVRESVDQNFMSRGTISRREMENLIRNSVRIQGVVEEPGQFTINYLNRAGNPIMGAQNNLPFDRQNNPGAVDFVQVEVTYPGAGPNVNRPIPFVFNPANAFRGSWILMSRAIFRIEGRLER